jgi:thiamine pyrophosphokinase
MGPAPPGPSPSEPTIASTAETATVVVVLPGLGSGAPVDPEVAAAIGAGATVIAVDGGVDHALALGLPVHRAVGDFDSVTEAGLARVEAAGASVERHPAAKDLTDLELALGAATATGARRIVVVGGRGGRLDHALANLLALAAPALADVDVIAFLDRSRVTVVRTSAVFGGRPGSLLSLLPVGGPAVGVRTDRLRYPLHDEDLPPGSARGLSNVLLDSSAGVSLRGGVLLAVQPDHEPDPSQEMPDDQ